MADLMRDEIDGFSLKLDANNLIVISQNLKIDITGETNKRNVLQLIQKHINNIEGEEHLISIKEGFEKEFVADVVADGKKENVPTSRVSGKATDDETKGTLSCNSLYSLVGAAGVDDERSAFHKDFKIRDYIGEKGQKDKLSYISLLKPIEEGRDKGYSDKEIVNAVLRPITPGLYLRNVLETTENLTLSRLMKFLQSHFVERNTTDLCQHLSSITQGSQGTATRFVYRAMSLRQKLIVLSKSPAAEIKYDQDLVQKLFLKSLETGLTSEAIMTEIKLLLENPSVSDEDLIFAVGQASSSDQQRSVKLNKNRIRPRVNAAEMECEAENELNLIPSN